LLLKRWWWLILAVLAVIGTWRVRIDVEMLNLLPPDQPAVQGLKLYQQYFANARELIITLRAPDAEKAERLAGALATQLREETNLVAGVSWQPPWMEQPVQVAELVAWLWLSQPPETFRALSNRLAAGHLEMVLAETKETLTMSLSPMDLARRVFDPYDLLSVPALTNFSGLSAEQGQGAFASTDGTFRVLYVQARSDLASYKSCASFLATAQQAVARLRSGGKSDWDGAVVRYTGRPAFVTEIATSMQRDLSGSIAGTALIIAILFWLSHRRWLPMLWLLALLALILVGTVGIGGLLLGSISVISLGFAAVLLGLAVDYAVVHYQEALAHPRLSVPEIRRAIAPSILWAAITTISAFLVLNLGGLPGLAQLGTLVALGIALAALVMVVAYLPPLFPGRREPGPGWSRQSWWSYFLPPPPQTAQSLAAENPSYSRTVFALTTLIVLSAVVVLCFRRPGLDRTTQALRPQHGDAEQALDEVTAGLGIPQNPIWIIARGHSERDVWQHLASAEALLDQARSNRVVSSYLLPAAMWPRVEFQEANRATARWLGAQGDSLRDTALREGFNTNALFLTDELVRTWARAGAETSVFWPTNQISRWLLKRFIARTPDEWLVMGLVTPASNRVDNAYLSGLSSRLAEHGVLLSGWELLGSTTLKRVQERLWLLVLPMVLLVLASLWLAFRRLKEVLLGVAVLLMSGLCLLAIMASCGWSWNLLNLMAMPLVLGTGVDYGLFMQLALRRHGGDVRLVRRSVGRALLLCGGTAIAGFGSLAWSTNVGMASLGKVCAVGIAANVLISVFLLPAWWVRLSPKSKVLSPKSSSPVDGQPLSLTGRESHMTRPPSFYQLRLWRFGLAVVRTLPAWLVRAGCVPAAELYYRTQRLRREVVVQNLLPALSGDRTLAETTARRLYRNFGLKLVDLWRVESGVPVHNWLTREEEQETILTAWKRGRGVLFLTPHLGNWEHGGLLLAQMGIKLTVLTQPEPEDSLTDLRSASRARWGIETLIVGRDEFAFLEVIKRLQDGAALAITIDRPPERSAVLVNLFGRPFKVSLVAAELARASGCALVGVTVVRRPKGYAVRVLPEFVYDRAALGNREARGELTRQIMRAFEPEIREHLDQWYQFVPVWPAASQNAE
jgi:predicted RND superfamily exporter protein/lauroyl/myristoyl acyltransferase